MPRRKRSSKLQDVATVGASIQLQASAGGQVPHRGSSNAPSLRDSAVIQDPQAVKDLTEMRERMEQLRRNTSVIIAATVLGMYTCRGERREVSVACMCMLHVSFVAFPSFLPPPPPGWSAHQGVD